MSRLNTSRILHIFLIVCLLVPVGVLSALSDPLQTIPTRTPTPGAQTPTSSPPTSVPPSATPAPPNPTSPPATNTPLPGNTATPGTGGPVSTATRQGLPTAVPCSDQPTIFAISALNVRSGPGTNYSLLGALNSGQVRHVIGRAADATWWVIQFTPTTEGWVFNPLVRVQGSIIGLPLVPAPPVGNASPTPGTAWNPTPKPACLLTETPTATQTPIDATAAGTAVGTSTAAPEGSSEPTVTAIVAGSAESTVLPTPASGDGEPTATLPAQPDQSAETTTIGSNVTSTPIPLAVDDPGPSLSFLPAAGALLLAAGLVLAFLRRRNRPKE